MSEEAVQLCKEMKENQTAILDCIKELTKAVTELAESFKKLEKEWEKWRKAGKF